MSRTTRRGDPWYWSVPTILRDGRATEIPGGKRWKARYKRIQRRRAKHALRTDRIDSIYDVLKPNMWAGK